jgi:spore coat-associated protein N
MQFRRVFLSGMLFMGVLSGSVEHGTMARFTTAVNTRANQFTAGNLRIDQAFGAGSTLSISGLVPGDSFDAQLNITNSGTIPFTYSMSTDVSIVSGSAALASALQLTVRAKTANPCSSRDGVVLFTGSLNAPGSDFSARPLAVAGSDPLCFTIVLPASTGTSVQGTNVAATFTFQAVQA